MMRQLAFSLCALLACGTALAAPVALPEFPARAPLGPQHAPVIRQALAAHGDLGWLYNPADLLSPYVEVFHPGLSISTLDGAVLLTAARDDGSREAFTPLGVDDSKAARLARALLADGGVARVEGLAPGAAAELRSDPAVRVTEDEKQGSYVYAAAALASLEGKALRQKRQHVRAFVEAHPDHEVVLLSDKPSLVDSLTASARQWLARKTFETDAQLADAKAEVASLVSLLDRVCELQLRGVALLVRGEVAGFAFGVAKSASTIVVLHEKADPAFPGAYQMINKLFAERVALAGGFAWIDRQNDGGIPGLRQAKRSYAPARVVPWHVAERAR